MEKEWTILCKVNEHVPVDTAEQLTRAMIVTGILNPSKYEKVKKMYYYFLENHSNN